MRVPSLQADVLVLPLIVMKLTIDHSAIGRIISVVGVLIFLPSVKAALAECVKEWEWV